MHKTALKVPTWLAPILGAGAVGVCPLCWIGSASVLTYLGFGALVPIWNWIVAVLLGIGLIGFLLDYRAHNNIYPALLLFIGGALLYLGRYVWGGAGFDGWQIWGSGSVIIIIAIIYNKRIFYITRKNRKHIKNARPTENN